MESYMMMLFVTLEQEKALKQFFLDNGWAYRKPDLSFMTDKIGPAVTQLSRRPERISLLQTNTTPTKKSTPGKIPKPSPVVKTNTAASSVKPTEEPKGKKRKLDSLAVSTDPPQKSVRQAENVTERPGTVVNLDGTTTMVDETAPDNMEESTVPGTAGEESRSNDGTDSDSESKNASKSSQTMYDEDKKPDINKLGKIKWKKRSSTAGSETGDKSTDICFPVVVVKKENFSCDDCDMTFTIQRHLKNHCKKVHGKDIEVSLSDKVQNGFYSCDQCQCSFPRVTSLKQHQRMKHGVNFKATQKEFECEVCLQKYHTQHILDLHKADKHGIQGSAKTYKCLECDEIFDKFRSFRLHKKTHEMKKHICEVCGKMFSRADIMNSHHQHVHLGIKRIRPKLKITEKKFVCEICGGRFYRRNNLTEHIKVKHTGQVLKHKCGMCELAFSRPSQLEHHQNKVHLHKKPYKCEKCNKACFSRHSLHDHKTICTMKKESMVRCEECGKLFTSKQNHRLHVQAVHSQPALVCGCGTVVRWASSVTKHKRRCSLYNPKLQKKPRRLKYNKPASKTPASGETSAVVYLQNQAGMKADEYREVVSNLAEGTAVEVSEAEAQVAESVGKLLEALPAMGEVPEGHEVTLVEEEVVEGGEVTTAETSYGNVRVVTEEGEHGTNKIYYVIQY